MAEIGRCICNLLDSGRTMKASRPTLDPEREAGESLQLMYALVVLDELANSQTTHDTLDEFPNVRCKNSSSRHRDPQQSSAVSTSKPSRMLQSDSLRL